jgi:protein-S-isoprenylcysteine O-methyltransferase Ste14
MFSENRLRFLTAFERASRVRPMRATEFDFNNRFWLIGLVFFFGFGLYNLDHVNFGLGLLHLLAPAINPDSARGNFWLRVIFGSGAALVFFAALFRTWATAYLKTEVVHDIPMHSEALVADGPYRRVRNPLYLANLFLAAGFGVMASRVGWAFMVLGMWVVCYRLILREEDGLRKTQGESYAAYLKAVPRLWPSIAPRVPASGTPLRWGQAFGGESLFWLFGVGVLIFAITLNMKYALIVVGASFPIYFLLVYLIKKNVGQASPSA